MVTARVVGQDLDYQLTMLEVDGVKLQMPRIASLSDGDEVRLRIRARDVSISTRKLDGVSTRNCLPATISHVLSEPDTAFAEVAAEIGQQTVRARITRQAVDELDLAPGKQVFLLIKGVSFDRRVLISARDK